MSYPLIDTITLLKHIDDPDWLSFDCRFDLFNPDWGYGNYLLGHIPRAVYVNLNTELSGTVTDTTGRHPLPDAVSFTRACANWGIEPQKSVVVYDTSGGSMASRMWWMLRAIGHDKVYLLDGGYAKWSAEGMPTQAGKQVNPGTTFLYEPHFNPDSYFSTTQVLDIINQDGWKLLDVRSPERFRGENEPIDKIAGHIPRAFNRFHAESLNPSGTFKPSTELKKEFEEILSGIDPDHIIVYCGSGVTSCHTLVAMEAAGLKGARLYTGSWSEWIRDPERPRIP